MGKEENVAIFKDTEWQCKNNERLKMSIKESVSNQKVVLEKHDLGLVDKNKYNQKAKIVVSKKRTFEAAAGYSSGSICVHNFASATNPGGGVVKGSSAQEECLCRCSTLYFCLNIDQMWNKFYIPHRNEQNPIHNGDIIYTPSVVVFKKDSATPFMLPEKDWYDVNVVTCAAPNLRLKPNNAMNSGDGKNPVKINDKDLLLIHKARLQRILNVSLLEGNETVILGAFGCGAFENNPEIVARAAKEVISEYLYSFKNIEFAVYCSPKDDRNYKTFERVLNSLINI